MSFIQIQDEDGYDMILSLKRIDRAHILSADASLTAIRLTPLDKDSPEEIVYSMTPVSEIWEQIKLRM